jgi:hypothetical protein
VFRRCLKNCQGSILHQSVHTLNSGTMSRMNFLSFSTKTGLEAKYESSSL